MSDSEFRPAFWLPGRHAQTIGARWLRLRSGVDLRRERVELPDGDFVDLDWVVRLGDFLPTEEHPLVLVLHGLEGSARSGYAFETYRALARRRIAGVGLNFRSCSGEINRLPRSYHSGDTGDVRTILGMLQTRFPGRSIGAVAFSLGGNVLVKYLGEQGKMKKMREIPADPVVRAAVSVSAPFDLAAGSANVERGFSRVYRSYLMRKLRRKIAAKRAVLEGRIDVDRTMETVTFREFDDAATAPLHGFDDADDYYRRSSSKGFIQYVSIPLLLIQAKDDPFLPASRLPRGEALGNPSVKTAFTQRGGHVGFLCGPPWAPVFWAEKRAAEFLEQHLV